MDRTDPLYRHARDVARQPIDWSNPTVALLQHEMHIDYVAHMPTFNLIAAVVPDQDDAVDWMMTLTEIQALSERQESLDTVLGQGRN